MNKVELLAPAGDMERLKSAIKYGADAVYLAGNSFGLRANAKNFDLDSINEAVKYAHSRNVKIYVTMNIIPHDKDLIGIEDYIREIDKYKVDALIISDPGIFMIAKNIVKNAQLHISTQASVTNSATINFWYNQGVKRVILARELSLDEIIEIRKEIPKDLEIEVFVHGAMCISYSGRCLLSNYMTGRDANRGDCAQACRWKYALQEEKRPGEYYPVYEDENGTYIFNSKDLCMLQDVDKLINAGINSLKIEGRMKTSYYVSTVIRSYRHVIDSYYDGNFNEKTIKKFKEEIEKASHRYFTKGFFDGKPDKNAQIYENSSYIRTYDFIGVVLDYDDNTKLVKVEQRNRFFTGEEIEIFGEGAEFHKLKIEKMYDDKMNEIEVANKAKQIVYFNVNFDASPGDFLRRKIK
ncbi:MAG: U32 family peptidase [Peptoniphilaceae bacterium]|nr:U32 family peptidase [Peptoniphilaceae bacterium]MDD7383489.1 U32 family peptidase [Peptoniphilaceae bacterium]MDY3738662.1 U32 family peptidase [Peptoniphilaceae bacterium]